MKYGECHNFLKNYVLVKILSREIFIWIFIKNWMVHPIGMNIHTMLPHNNPAYIPRKLCWLKLKQKSFLPQCSGNHNGVSICENIHTVLPRHIQL
jgi:hypothetical protein